jgi:hypothetical protein
MLGAAHREVSSFRELITEKATAVYGRCERSAGRGLGDIQERSTRHKLSSGGNTATSAIKIRPITPFGLDFYRGQPASL